MAPIPLRLGEGTSLINASANAAANASSVPALEAGSTVDVGRLLVVGPRFLAERRTCVSGQTCAVPALEANFPRPGDSLALLDTCGVLDDRGDAESAWSPMRARARVRKRSVVFPLLSDSRKSIRGMMGEHYHGLVRS